MWSIEKEHLMTENFVSYIPDRRLKANKSSKDSFKHNGKGCLGCESKVLSKEEIRITKKYLKI